VKKSPFTRSAARDLHLARKWLEECGEQHSSCLTTPTRLPTRVIDVGTDKRTPRLIIAEGKVAPYLALSHRWGGPDRKRLITTTQSLPYHCYGIRPEAWPKTFQDAINVARALDIQYLWIDSLCIIQDDTRDWETEALKMNEVYANAYATIFAERSSHCDDGLFRTGEDARAQLQWVREVAYENPANKRTYSILLATRSFHNSDEVSLVSAFCLVDNHHSHLQDRGWIMQEEILSRRKLCFSSTELHWQCNQRSQCECGLRSEPEVWSKWNDMTKRLLFTRGADGKLTRGLTPNGREPEAFSTINKSDRSWKQLIELYTARHLTSERDRLPALSGIASQLLSLGRKYEDYLAGIWRQDESQLLWFTKTGSRPSHRHHVYYAPSWSWASVTGSVEFHNMARAKAITWKVLNSASIPAGENILGPVSSAWICIKAQVASVALCRVEVSASRSALRVQQEWDKGDYSLLYLDGKTYCLRMSVNSRVSSALLLKNKPRDREVRVDAAEDWKSITAASGKGPAKCLLLFAGLQQVLEYGTAHPVGLLLRQSQSDNKCWKRIALVLLDDSWDSWKPFTVEKTVVVT
jgi:hypothetical protein